MFSCPHAHITFTNAQTSSMEKKERKIDTKQFRDSVWERCFIECKINFYFKAITANEIRECRQINRHPLVEMAKAKGRLLFSGLPQLGYAEVEPIILDELHIALGGGPNGYKAQFKEIAARGVSAVRVTGLRARVADDEVQLQLALSIPKIRAVAKYRSSGTLILVQASGAGDYWGEYGKCTLRLESRQPVRRARARGCPLPGAGTFALPTRPVVVLYR
jgi:hypothetical protein